MWSEQRSILHSFLRRCCIVTYNRTVVKYYFQYKFSTQNLIRSKQRKSSSRSSPSCRRKAISTPMMEMVAFCFGIFSAPIRAQKLICSKQRKGDHSSNHRRWNRYISTDVYKPKHGFADFEKIKRSLKKLSLNACNLSKKVIQ